MNSTPRLRRTKQRQVILEELRKVTCHPTADELYNMARRRLPHISMGTVYRNLELLVQQGTIQSLDIAGTQKRFDGNAVNHYHLRCLKCGRVEDAHTRRSIPIHDVVKEVIGFEIIGHRLELVGLCPKCRGKHRGASRRSAPKTITSSNPIERRI